MKTVKLYSKPLWYGLAVLFGVLSGLSGNAGLESISAFIADVFIKLFQCVSLPIIALSLIVTLSELGASKSMQAIWRRSLFYTLTTTLIAASVAALLYMLVQPSNIIAQANAAAALPEVVQSTDYISYLLSLVPENIFSPFLERQVVGVLLVGIVVGIGIRHISDEAARTTFTHFFKGAHALFLTITTWIVAIIPLALFAFISGMVVQLKSGDSLGGLRDYFLIILLANLIQGLLVLPVWLKLNNINPYQTMRRMLPALSLAFFSKSSSAVLPITMRIAEKKLQVSPQVSRFVLPLCTTINMNGCAAFILTTVMFLMQNNGVDITWMTVLPWIVIATIASIGNAGIPMGCFFLSTSLLVSMDVPVNLLMVILPFYGIIDMIETALNVWSDSCVVKVVDTQYKAGALTIDAPSVKQSDADADAVKARAMNA